MKKQLVAALVAVMVIAAIFTGNAYSAVMKMMPEDADFVLKIGSIESLYKNFSVTPNSIFGNPVPDLAQMQKEMGFNPLSIDELKANGLDTSREVSLLITDLIIPDQGKTDPSFNAVLFFPVSNGKKMVETVKQILTKDNSAIKFSQDGKMSIFTETQSAGKNFVGYMAEKDKYLMIGTNPAGDAKSLMGKLLSSQGKLTGSTAFKNVAGKIDSSQDIFAYLNIKKIAEKNLTAIQKLYSQSYGTQPLSSSKGLKYLKDCEGAGFAIDMNSKDFALNAVTNMVHGAPSLDAMKGITLDKNMTLGQKENPVTLWSIAVNPVKYFQLIMDTMEDDDDAQFKNWQTSFKTNFGIDFMGEIINNLTGNVNLGIYDGASINMANYNALLSIGVKNDAKALSVIDKLIATLPPQQQQAMITKDKVGGIDAYAIMAGFVQVYAGIKNHNLIVSVGKPMFEKALAANAASGFLSGMKDKKLASSLKTESNSAYLNAAELMKAVNNFAPMLPPPPEGQPPFAQKIGQILSQFQYFYTANSLKGDSFFANIDLKTNFKEPFFIGLKKLIDSAK
ncbi:hypothetical protein QUF76_06115 [Desulfobacterales bacterium HSG16]|nr:hypothetical protein [Desulfobacterales bacterium HSG16]